MTVNEGCPMCQGRCCEYGVDDYRGAHRSEAFHTCLACANGTKPTVWTAEQERAAVVRFLREQQQEAFDNDDNLDMGWVTKAIERGEHRREEEE